jgi:valyl-tRNA synthetase|tara:strand:- start:7749 stop:10382 length:2634 start_codon:yes stop_codon:yes gene_type:complete
MKTSIPKAYDPKKVEDAIYEQWESSDLFKPDSSATGKPFTISMPPPNTTGILHIGHAMFVTLQDIMTRYARMNGRKALWLPGTDHAAIATESRVDKDLIDETGKSKHDLGREDFLKKVHAYIKDSQGTIKNQIRKMGASCDWSRERYTLDEGLTRCVQEVFIKMYNDGLIYRGNRIVNWDPKMQTTVSDDEIEYVEKKTPFYTFKYGPFEIATARPETKFGDKYVVMHPDDKRYAKYKHGEQFEADWINGKITATVVKDESVDPEFGTGVMTITPWHDTADFDIAQRHKLDREQIIDLNGKLLDIAEEFKNMEIGEARPLIVEKLKHKGLLIKTDNEYINKVATSYRGGGIIEPQIMEQWFVNVDKPARTWKGKKRSLKEISIDAVKSKDIDIIPSRFKKTYFHWMENLHDWCISRQLYFGHRIPAWFNKNDKTDIKVGIQSPGKEYEQDQDTLDTWFSSAMWTFSTLLDEPKKDDTIDSWIKRNKILGTDLATFHPTNVLETAYEILFFWVARMILMTTYVVGEIPFKTVYLHGLVRDKQGRKMSKTLDNGIDPLEMTQKYGADATRLSLVIGTTPGNDTRMYEEKIAGYRNFVNKIWNIARFIIIYRGGTRKFDEKTLADKWIESRLQNLIKEVTNHYEQFEYSIAGEKIYEFLWHELADWYVEISKQQDHTLAPQILLEAIKLLHPFTPFITEEIFQMLKKEKLVDSKDEWLMTSTWPKAQAKIIKPKIENDFSALQELITEIRDLRATYHLSYSQKLNAVVTTKKYKKLFQDQELVVEALTKVKIQVLPSKPVKREEFIRAHTSHFDVFIKLSAKKFKQQSQRLSIEKEQLEQYIEVLEKKLANKEFIQNAPPDIVGLEKKKLQDAQNKLRKL